MQKRLFDIILSTIFLILLSPLLLLIAITVKITSKGSILYKQDRVGINKNIFKCYKFRTMHENSDESTHSNHIENIVKNNLLLDKLDSTVDSRVTSFGRFLRLIGLDELPQLLNVIKGDMSLVGPRPCIEYELKYFDNSDRFKIRPGITGLWQVHDGLTTFNNMIEMDLYYIQKQNIYLDLHIILKTCKLLLDNVKRSINFKFHLNNN